MQISNLLNPDTSTTQVTQPTTQVTQPTAQVTQPTTDSYPFTSDAGLDVSSFHAFGASLERSLNRFVLVKPSTTSVTIRELGIKRNSIEHNMMKTVARNTPGFEKFARVLENDRS